MKKYIFFIIGAFILAWLVVWSVDFFALFKKPLSQGELQERFFERGGPGGQESSHPASLKVEVVASRLRIPWSLVFTSDTRMLVTERKGGVRVIENGTLREEPLYRFSEVASAGEEGLMGLALDPEYTSNKYVYFSLAYEKSEKLWVKVVRLSDKGDVLEEPFTLIDDIPAAQYHAGSRIKFGPDKKLYITTGDATDKDLPQDIESLGGKILRIEKDGSVPSDNPFPGNPVWSYGHRNAQGIAWHPETGEMYATEHGPSVFDGPAGGDELNRIVKGGNYGWPDVSHEKSKEGMIDPLLVFTPAEAPAGMDFYTSSVIPQFKNQLFFTALKGQGLIRVELDPENPDRVIRYEKLKEVNVGRIREVVTGRDGAIYFMTSNRDGRGRAGDEDDRIYRLVKQ